MKKIIFQFIVFFTITLSATDTNIVFVHGLNSSSDIWHLIAPEVSKLVHSQYSGEYVELDIDIDINQNMYCWDSVIGVHKHARVKCTELWNNDEIYKNLVDEDRSSRIFGLDKGTFSINDINWNLRYGITTMNINKNEGSNHRVFAINFSHNKDLSFDAQGAQLKAMIDDIAETTHLNNFILIGHSMGGLAIRAYIQNEDIKDIESIVTVDTPHLGGRGARIIDLNNASTNLASDSQAFKFLNHSARITGKYENIKVTFMGYSDDAEPISNDCFKYLNTFSNGDGSVSVASQMGLENYGFGDIYRIIFSPSITRYSKLVNLYQVDKDLTPFTNEDYILIDESIVTADYWTNPLGINSAHSNIMENWDYISKIKELINKDKNYCDLNDIGSHQYKDDICSIYIKGLVKGYYGDEYRPDNQITRAEFTKIILLSKYSQKEIDENQINVYFTDVKSSDWYAKYIRFASLKYIVKGYANGTFQPNKFITFAEASKVIVKTCIQDINPTDFNDWKSFYTNIIRREVVDIHRKDDELISRADMARLINNVNCGKD